MGRQSKDEMLIHQAKAVLDFNWTGEYTQPGPRLYPHQWSWDSALIAIGYAHYDQWRATKELEHLLQSQWRNGLLPQIVFNSRFVEYFPGPNFWHADESPDAPRNRATSGVIQPPVHATAALHIYRYARDETGAKRFLEYAFPRLKAWHDYLYRERDPDGEGLVYIRHPWESGMDNAPVWAGAMVRLHLRADQIPEYHRVDTHTGVAADRPLNTAYDRYAYLVKFFRDRDYDEAKIRKDCPFLMQDVLFNSLLAKANRDLAEIARIVGGDPSPHEELAERTKSAVNRKFWNEDHGTYLDYDVVEDGPVPVYFGPSLAGALYAGIPSKHQAERLLATLNNDGFGLSDESIKPIPSYDVHGFGFSPERYWRGPVWINIDWFLMHGLADYGYEDHAKRVRETIVELCRKEGFREYFDPFDGSGLGSNFFSWSAALLINVLMDPR